MFRMKIIANQSATVIQIVSVLHFIRSPVNCVWDAVVCNALSEVLVVEAVRVLSR